MNFLTLLMTWELPSYIATRKADVPLRSQLAKNTARDSDFKRTRFTIGIYTTRTNSSKISVAVDNLSTLSVYK